MTKRLSLAVGVTALATMTTAPAPAEVTQVVANKTTHQVLFYEGDRLVLTLTARFGYNPRAKEREGDHATPVGTYLLHPARPSRRFHQFL